MKLQVLLVTLFAVHVLAGMAPVYKLEIKTSSRAYSGAAGRLHATLVGLRGKTVDHVEVPLDDPMSRDSLNIYTVAAYEDPGKITCVKLSTESDDAWLVDYVAVQSGAVRTTMYNTQATYLSTDDSEGVPSLELCQQGKVTYTITITTNSATHMGSNAIYPTIAYSDRKSFTSTGTLLNPGEVNYKRGGTDTFVVRNMMNIRKGRKCIIVIVGGDDAWQFDKISIRKNNEQGETVFENKDGITMSTDKSEGVSTLELCNRKTKGN